MKRIIGFLVLTFALFHNTAKAEMVEGVEVNRSAQGINFTQSIDMSKYGTAGIQVVYADGTPASHTLTSGVKQTASITVVNNSSALIGAQASVMVSVRSTTSALGDAVTLNGIVFTEGVHWTSITSTSTAATNLKNVVDAHPDFDATVSGSTVTVKYTTYGTSGNGLPVTTTDATNLAISASTFGSGINRHTVTINSTTLSEGTDFDAHATSRTAAGNLTTAINEDATLATQVIASSGSAGSVITLTALYPGSLNYSLSSSTSGFTTSGFTNGANPDISIADDIFTETAHGLTTGLQVRYDTTSGSAPGGLTTATTYYAIKLTDNTYKLATSSTNAVAGTNIDITTLPSTVASYTMTPCPLVTVGGNGFYWQASNDNSNFTNLTNVTLNGVAVTSVTYSSAGNSLYNFGEFPWRYLRMVFSAPTRGGISLTTRIFGREE